MALFGFRHSNGQFVKIEPAFNSASTVIDPEEASRYPDVHDAMHAVQQHKTISGSEIDITGWVVWDETIIAEYGT